LNIIIGPNGSGKTNFLEFLLFMFQIQYPYFDAEFDNTFKLIINGINYIWRIKFSGAEYNEEFEEFEKEILEWIHLENEPSNPLKFKYSANSPFNPGNQKTRDILYPNFYPISYLSFNLPIKIKGLDEYLDIVINKKTLKIENTPKGNYVKFINSTLSENFYNGRLKKINTLNKKNILSHISINEETKRNLKNFSPIQDIRVNKNFLFNENINSYVISSLTFEFYVNEEWLIWPMLSDGTKRLFYLISEVTLNKGLCLVEEPELGTYPEQLDLIMQFLKEQAKEKQIILTTHAPRVLDHLKDEELNRIIITKYEKDKGTKMRHLTSKEIMHIIEYTEEKGYTSDLWTMTDFFEDEESLA